jgi:hypothetical protein
VFHQIHQPRKKATVIPDIQLCYFSPINGILDDLKAGIQTSTQNYVLTLLISANLFWPGTDQGNWILEVQTEVSWQQVSWQQVSWQQVS